ncbi:D-alanyl-D-alanine carboxypeptidase [Paenibacillus sp. CGMCC 1.16610]|uniref:serine-type D-Ala-D-Ala carboxypeptidase n=2 Tax=Paenibacillus TaxID=44249 RepID=A0ABU6DHU9_9BACL|nr:MULTISPECIES: D-alanyl-D-alanine carboxypeptidase family protein [Paenibacillus]MBA2942505.1 D-alanyl-D-alanine carboxypeptidase [Paenibacillus sp. CGMCC 1.16610]MCY9660407.1 D-alanyl-D-alanine carboxypeptidase [Paenibacillus anseongense]MEB4797244.1 D-alanyl-D-alanine carboxypeptidase [Paenibacillus chondroitinus]MVQ34577.1 D-alanyl-D-alanine carboxypeptidase [Paenibacillus anseongense]
MRFFSFTRKKIALVLGVSLIAQSVLLHIQPAFAADTKTPAATTAPTTTTAPTGGELKVNAKSAIIMEASTGAVLYEMNADEALPPASMAKMMTEYLAMESIKEGKFKWDSQVTASKNAADVIGSGQLIAENETLSFKDMFSAMSIYSANDASVAFAELLGGGSEENFAKMMNEKAKQLGMSDQAHFISATGLSRADLKNPPQSIEGETKMTARDAAILAYNILKDHKEVLEFTKIPSLKLRPTDKTPMINWNWMLEGNSTNANFKKYAYTGLDGLKTGSTDDAGYCFTGTAERNGMRLITVVMGTKTEPERFNETRKLLDYGFNNFEIKPFLNAKQEIDSLKIVNIKKGVQTQVPLVTKTGLTFVTKKGAKDTDFKITAEPLEESKLVAPIAKGDTLGKVKVSYNGQEKTADLIANEDVEKGSWIRLLFRSIKNFFGDMFKGIKGGS